ncbi:MAG: tRNA epoxyqueuosine(34) reductase QueG [Anaerolineae bacterium]|nr:tRNA epoxyqueuosine(34) reductase QueG [Anaerolineae bacterium]
MLIYEDIKTEAIRLGFEFLGLISPQTPPHYPVFESWLKDGFHAGMAYLQSDYSRQARRNPAYLFPECRTILVVSVPYPEVLPSPDVLKGNIASYALGTDYHLFIPEALEKLRSATEKITGKKVNVKACSDSAAILEHDFAWLAGLGWIGKNTCLISRKSGSFSLLAELLIDLEIENESVPEKDYCGSCTRCITACPTGCIQNNRTIDASRCLSYHSIENKGVIPLDLRHHFSNQIFGCDICQSVCPWNRKKKDDRNYSLFPQRFDLAHPDLLNEVYLSPQVFKQKFYNTPIIRTKHRGYLRNIGVALGNSHSSEAISPLNYLLSNEAEPLVRAHSAWALGQINHIKSREVLSDALRREVDPGVIEEIKLALDSFI